MLRKIFNRGAVMMAGTRQAASVGISPAAGWSKVKSKVTHGVKVWEDGLTAIEKIGSIFTRTGRVVVVGVTAAGVVKITYEERNRSEETVDATSGYERARARVFSYLDSVGGESAPGPGGKLTGLKLLFGPFKPPVPTSNISDDWVWVEVVEVESSANHEKDAGEVVEIESSANHEKDAGDAAK